MGDSTCLFLAFGVLVFLGPSAGHRGKDSVCYNVFPLLTTSNGAPVDDKITSMTVGPVGPIVLQDFVLLDELAHFNRERIPERVMHAKGAGSNCEPDEDDLLGVTKPSSPLLGSTCTSADPSAGNDVTEMDELEISLNDTEESESEAFEITPDSQNSLEACAVRYFAGYAVRACLKKHKCQACLEDLAQATASRAPDEALIRNRQFIDASGEPSEALISPTETTVNVARTTLGITDKMIVKIIQCTGIKKQILSKCKQVIFRNYQEWMMCGSECYCHRLFFLNKLITAKLYCKLKEMSKDLRQPGGKHGHIQKLRNLQGN